MTIDKDKIAKNSLRYIQKGQFQKAIDEYRKVLSSDPRDIRTRLKLADLYGRVGRKKDAVDECLQVAESYSDQGFYLKSIAVYKQALRIDPDSPRLYRSMGELYVKQGLIGDALGVFKKGVDLLRQLGQVAEAEEVLSRMEEMAPENVAIKIHLAELYLADGKMGVFEGELEKIVLQLKGEGRTRKLLQAMEGFYEKSHRHLSVLKRLAELYADLNEDERALELIRQGLAENPTDRDLRILSLRVHLTLGNLTDARRIAYGLHEEDPDDLFILERLVAIAQARDDRAELARAHKSLAKAYARKGLSEKEEHHYLRVLEHAPQDAEARLALGEAVSEQGNDLGEGGEVIDIDNFWGTEASARGGAGSSLAEGLTEADLYLKYGMEDRAAEKLSELCEAAPENIEVHKKLRDLYQRRGDRDGWIREQLRIAGLHLDRKHENDALRAFQGVLEVAPDNAEALRAVQYLKPDALLLRRAPAPNAAGLAAGRPVGSAEDAETGPSGGSAPRDPAEDSLYAGLAEADFYEAQGLIEEALSRLHRLHEKFSESSLIAERIARLSGGAEASTGFVDLQAEVLDAAVDVAGGDRVAFQDFEITELDDIVREFKSGIAEKLEEGDYETHYNLGTAYREMGLLDDAIQEFQLAARSSEKARDAYTSMSMAFQELGRTDEARSALRMALAVLSNSPDDRAAIYYELGVLARGAGDWQGARQAFEKAEGTVPSFRDAARQIQVLLSKG